MVNKGIKTAAVLMALSGQANAVSENVTDDVKNDAILASVEQHKQEEIFLKNSYNREIKPLRGFYYSHFNDALRDIVNHVDVENGISVKIGFNAQGDEVTIGYINGELNCITKEKDSDVQIKERIIKDKGISEVEINEKGMITKIIRAPGCNACISYNGKTRECPDNYDYPKRVTDFRFGLNKSR